MRFLNKLFGKQKKQTASSQIPSKEQLEDALEAFKNRKKYSQIDEQTLREISDENLLLSIFDFICDQVIKDDWKNAYEKVKKLPIGFQHIYGLWLLEAEVNNGGFNQYFYNTSGQFIDESYNGCVAIGAHRTAEVVKKAVETFMEEKEMQLEMRKRGTKESFVESYEETKLGECDTEFYKYSEGLQKLQIAYIRNNYKDFQLTTAST